MGGPLDAVQASCHHALTALREVGARAPGSPLTQALLAGALTGMLAYQLMKKRYRLPPGPWPLPLLGNLLCMSSKEEQLYQRLDRWAREKYGPIISLYFGPVLCVMLNDLPSVTEALLHKGSDYAGRPSLHSLHVITEGSKDIAFTDYSPAWKLHRKIALKALRHYMTGSHLDKVIHQVMTKVGDQMETETGPFDPHLYTSTLMFHIIDCICFGKAKPFNDPELQHLVYLFDSVNAELGNGFYEDIIPLMKHWPTPSFRKVTSMMGEVSQYVKRNVQQHRENFSPLRVKDVADSILLAQLEAAREESADSMAMFTDVHVRQTLNDIFGAGVDTSRTTLDWALLFVAGHPEVQKRAQAEIDAVTGSEMPGVGHRSQLQYCQAVMQETLRLGIAVPMALPHKTICDTTIGEYEVPKDTMVMVNLWAVCHDPALWESPEAFNPERFLDDQGNLKPTPKAWLPFSVGRRMCLGETVAKPELLLILACLLQRFTLSLPDGAAYCPQHLLSNLAINAPKPYQLVFTPRSGRRLK